MLIGKIGKYKLIKWFDSSEPQHCEKQGCEEEFNGLNYFCLEVGTKFKLGVWLCDKCSKEFTKLLEVKPNSSPK
jgi:hypothetical protein